MNFKLYFYSKWCRKNDAIGKKKQNSAAERWSPKVTKPFDEMNSIASNLLLHLTSSMRFEGPLNGNSDVFSKLMIFDWAAKAVCLLACFWIMDPQLHFIQQIQGLEHSSHIAYHIQFRSHAQLSASKFAKYLTCYNRLKCSWFKRDNHEFGAISSTPLPYFKHVSAFGCFSMRYYRFPRLNYDETIASDMIKAGWGPWHSSLLIISYLVIVNACKLIYVFSLDYSFWCDRRNSATCNKAGIWGNNLI